MTQGPRIRRVVKDTVDTHDNTAGDPPTVGTIIDDATLEVDGVTVSEVCEVVAEMFHDGEVYDPTGHGHIRRTRPD